jgi:AraC-like DNA-binding protein
MSGRKTSSKIGAWPRAALRPETPGATAAPAAAPLALSDPLRQQKYQALIRHHLDRLLDRLFADVTGLHFHIAWAPVTGRAWKDQTLPTACSVCCRLSGSSLKPGCRVCGPQQLARVLAAGGEGRHFTCRLGVRNYWLTLRLQEETLGVAYLQALDGTHRKQLGRNPAGHAGASVVGRLAFARFARMLRFVVQHVQTASLSDLQKADLTNAGQVVVALEKEQARLHEVLQRHLPVTPQAPRRDGSKSHPEQIVHCMLECIERDYAKPITLLDCALKLGMNAAYLSDLFSHALGVPFKTHLTELRMAKAQLLLGDPTRNVSEVATAVGYASENRFRIAFKKATGLSPKLWRETMQTTPSVGISPEG